MWSTSAMTRQRPNLTAAGLLALLACLGAAAVGRVRWTGRGAAELRRGHPPAWGTPVELFDGKDLSGWKARPPATKHGWVVRDGLLVNATPGTDLMTERTFTDFQIHAEFRY